jgi:hypothetical protein
LQYDLALTKDRNTSLRRKNDILDLRFEFERREAIPKQQVHLMPQQRMSVVSNNETVVMSDDGNSAWVTDDGASEVAGP